MPYDFDALVKAEMADFSALLHSLDDAQWDAPSLCDGWAVRHVVAHQCVGHTMKLSSFPVLLVKYRGNIAKGSSVESTVYGDTHSPAELLSVYDSVRVEPLKAGLGKVIRPHEVFTDHLIHHSDVRRPLGLAREIPVERLQAALSSLPKIGGFLKSNALTKGLAMVATDVEFSGGEGPEVRGPAEDLLLAFAGRPIGLESLDGPGLPVLTERVKARN